MLLPGAQDKSNAALSWHNDKRNQSIFLNPNEVKQQAKSRCRKEKSSGKLNTKYKFTPLPAQKIYIAKGKIFFNATNPSIYRLEDLRITLSLAEKIILVHSHQINPNKAHSVLRIQPASSKYQSGKSITIYRNIWLC